MEGLVKALTGWAIAAGLSGLGLSALVLGLDIESTGAGVAATLDGLPGTALGTSIGAAIFLVTVGLGLAAMAAPFSVDTPRPLLLAAGSRPRFRSSSSPTGASREAMAASCSPPSRPWSSRWS